MYFTQCQIRVREVKFFRAPSMGRLFKYKLDYLHACTGYNRQFYASQQLSFVCVSLRASAANLSNIIHTQFALLNRAWLFL